MGQVLFRGYFYIWLIFFGGNYFTQVERDIYTDEKILKPGYNHDLKIQNNICLKEELIKID